MKNFFVSLFSIALFACCASSARAQFYRSGDEFFRLKWHKIENNRLKIIYSDSTQADAQQIFDTLNNSQYKLSKSLYSLPRKIPLILRSNSVTSNGFVTNTPWRSELYLNAPNDFSKSLWFDQLAKHEYRHVAQIDHIHQNMPKFFTALFGEIITGIYAFLYFPLWYYEGDAVAIETRYSKLGRGYDPEFLKYMKVIFERPKKISYSKMLHGSNKDLVPSRYHFGYFMTTHIKEEYGTKFWSEATKKLPHKAYFFWNTLSGYMKKYHGKNLRNTYDHFLDSVQYEFEKIAPKDTTKYETATAQEYQFYSQITNCFISNAEIYCRLSGQEDVPKIIHLKSGKTLFELGYTQNSYVRANDTKAIWTIEDKHPRWGNSSKSMLYTYDFQDKKIKKNSLDGNYFSPNLSQLGKIVLIKKDAHQHYSLVVYDKNEVLKQFDFPEEEAAFHPTFFGEKKIIYGLRTQNQSFIESFDIETNEREKLFELGSNQFFSNFVVEGDRVLFNWSFSGVENIYELDLETKQVSRLTSSKYGAKDGFIMNDSLYYSNFGVTGFRVSKSKIRREHLESISEGKYPFAEKIKNIEDRIPIIDTTNTTAPEIHRHKKLENAFNFHSAIPYGYNLGSLPGEVSSKTGIQLLSQSLLSDFTQQVGLYYDFDTRFAGIDLNFAYYGAFPVFRFVYHYQRETFNSSVKIPQSQFSLQTELPLSWIRNNHNFILRPKFSYGITTAKNNKIFGNNTRKGNTLFHDIEPQVLFSYYQTGSPQKIYPKIGFRTQLGLKVQQFSVKNFGENITHWVAHNFYLPGVSKHQGIQLSLRYFGQNQDNLYSLGLPFKNILGARSYYFKKYMYLEGNYNLLIWNPDFNIRTLLYLKKVDATVFYQRSVIHSVLGYNPMENKIVSYELPQNEVMGVSVNFNFHLLNIQLPFRMRFINYYSFPEKTFDSTVSFNYVINF